MLTFLFKKLTKHITDSESSGSWSWAVVFLSFNCDYSRSLSNQLQGYKVIYKTEHFI